MTAYSFYLGLMEWYQVGIPDWQWNSQWSVVDNLNYYKFFHPYIIPICLLGLLYIIYIWSKALYVDVFKAKEITQGKVLEIKQSAMRVNNKNLTDLRLEYLGLEAWFRDLNSDLAFQLSVGDIVDIRYAEDDHSKAVFHGVSNLEASNDH
jgi:hypothetical protein